jgi:hypothetical protein
MVPAVAGDEPAEGADVVSSPGLVDCDPVTGWPVDVAAGAQPFVIAVMAVVLILIVSGILSVSQMNSEYPSISVLPTITSVLQ